MRITRFSYVSLSTLFLLPITMIHAVNAQQSSPALSTQSSEDPKSAEVRKLLQGYYDEMDRGTERFDLATSYKYIAKDAKLLDRDGKKVSLQAAKDGLQMGFRRAISAKSSTAITSITYKNDTAIVTSNAHLSLRTKGDDGLIRDLDIDSQSRDFWMKVKGKWLIKQARATDRTMKLNGQIIQE